MELRAYKYPSFNLLAKEGILCVSLLIIFDLATRIFLWCLFLVKCSGHVFFFFSNPTSDFTALREFHQDQISHSFALSCLLKCKPLEQIMFEKRIITYLTGRVLGDTASIDFFYEVLRKQITIVKTMQNFHQELCFHLTSNFNISTSNHFGGGPCFPWPVFCLIPASVRKNECCLCEAQSSLPFENHFIF